MRVVSNTSPLSNLEVASELAALSHPAGSSLIQSALSQGWLRPEPTAGPPAPPSPLDRGESAAIALALVVRDDVLLMDERRGRAAARALGLTVGGLLGELLHARLQGWIPNLRNEIARVLTKSGPACVGSELDSPGVKMVGDLAAALR